MVRHFGYENVKAWMKGDLVDGRKRARMVVGVQVEKDQFLAIPIKFKSEVRFEYQPMFNASLN